MNPSPIREDKRSYDVVILGSGYAGLMAALRLCRSNQALRIALVNASDRFLEVYPTAMRWRRRILSITTPSRETMSSTVSGTRICALWPKVASWTAP
jgi:NADH:ubiquinone reductase (H+-translocating)